MIENQIAVLLEASMSLLPFNDLSKRREVPLNDRLDVLRLRDHLTFSFPLPQRGLALMAAYNWVARPGERQRNLIISQHTHRNPGIQQISRDSGVGMNSDRVKCNMNFIWGCQNRDLMFFGYSHDEINSLIQSQELVRCVFPTNNGHRLLFVARD